MDKTARSFNEACTTTLGQNFKGYYADNAINKDDILHSVYGILHSPEYQHRFAADLKKMLPHIPFAGDFRAFSQAGRDLANWHLHYETVEPYPLHESMPLLETDDTYRVQLRPLPSEAKMWTNPSSVTTATSPYPAFRPKLTPTLPTVNPRWNG